MTPATLASALSIARERTGTDSNSLTDTLGIDFANVASFKMKRMLIDRGIDAAPVQEATRSITDATGTYLYPGDMFYIPKNMELNWWDTTNQNLWKQLDKVQDTNLPPNQGMSWLRKNQSASSPLVDYRGDYFEILPTPNASTWGGVAGSSLSGAVRLFYYLQPTAGSTTCIFYAATTDTMTPPESLDYFLFADLIAAVYEHSIGKITTDDMDKIFDTRVGELVHLIQGDGNMPTRARGLGISGWEY